MLICNATFTLWKFREQYLFHLMPRTYPQLRPGHDLHPLTFHSIPQLSLLQELPPLWMKIHVARPIKYFRCIVGGRYLTYIATPITWMLLKYIFKDIFVIYHGHTCVWSSFNIVVYFSSESGNSRGSNGLISTNGRKYDWLWPNVVELQFTPTPLPPACHVGRTTTLAICKKGKERTFHLS